MIAAAISAARGDWTTADARGGLLTEAARSGQRFAIIMDALAKAHIGRLRDQPAAVIVAFEPFIGVDRAAPIQWRMDVLVDAYTAAGDLESAEIVLRDYESQVAQRGTPLFLLTAHQSRAVLHAARDDQDASFQAALVLAEQVDVPFDRALLHLAYGKYLRRRGMRTAAHSQLELARALFVKLKARPDPERCDREIAACRIGGTSRVTGEEAELTPQERAVAQLVARGLTNRQVARQLIISVKTVEYHLARIYGKLGISSRVQRAGQRQGR